MKKHQPAHALIASLALACGLHASAAPDQIVYNATIYTANDALPTAEAIAIEDDRIVGIGDLITIQALADEETRMIDLEGRTVLPGLIDAHGHMKGLGDLQVGTLDLSGTTSYEEVIERVRQQAAELPEGTWILGRGWDHESWPSRKLPDHEMLSDIVPDHPVWLIRVDGHAGLANEAAMQAAGVDEHTQNPDGGEVIRAEGDRPTGVFIDNAESYIERAVPPEARGQTRDQLIAAQQMCIEAGLTGVHDMGVPPAQVELYRQLDEERVLKLRIYAVLPGNFAVRYFDQNDILITDRVTARATKLYMDGAMGSRGAWMIEPYTDRPTDDEGNPYTGLTVSEPEFIDFVARHGTERGYQVCVHAIGDRANRRVLDAFEQAGASDARHRVEHAQLLHPDDIARFASLGVIPSMQPTHCTSDMRWVADRVGDQRAQGAYAWRSLIETGVPIAGGSDFPVESHNPFLGFYAAVTRQNHEGQPEGGWQPDQRMTRDEALKSFTIWAAYAAFEEDQKGTLELGKLADFIVIDRDVMTCEPSEILNTRVLSTVIGGEWVFVAEE
ncbi:MAG: amidohydrolase [Phycisphaerales bacterium]|nr:amidohydrolase [Phycisphaerales bacterium]